MQKYITLFLVLILAFSFINFITIPERVNAITQFNLNTNYSYGLPNPYQSVLLNGYLVIGFLSSPTQLNLFVFNNKTGTNTTIGVANFPEPLNNFYLFPFNNSKILIVTFYTHMSLPSGYWVFTTDYDICVAIGEAPPATCTGSVNIAPILVVNTYLFSPSGNAFSNPQQANITTFSPVPFNIGWSGSIIATGIPNCNYVGSNSYSLSSINPRVFICSSPFASDGQLAFWLIVLNYNFISSANIATVNYTTNIGQEIFYSIVDTQTLLSGYSASGWIDNNSTNIAFTATYSPSTNALSVSGSNTLTTQPFPFLHQSYGQASNLYGMLGNANASTGYNSSLKEGSGYTFYIENWFNTPQYVPNNGYFYPTIYSTNPIYVGYYYFQTSGNPTSTSSVLIGFASNAILSDAGGTFYYPSSFRIITTLVFYYVNTSTSNIVLDSFNNATNAQFINSQIVTQSSGIFLTGILQYYGNIVIYWSGSTNRLYVQLVSGYLSTLTSITFGGGGGTTNTPPPPSPTSNFTLSFTPSIINMFLATIFIFIPAIILIPFLGIAGFIAGATLGTIFAVIAGFIPYWALVVIVLLIIALILRGKSFSKED